MLGRFKEDWCEDTPGTPEQEKFAQPYKGVGHVTLFMKIMIAQRKTTTMISMWIGMRIRRKTSPPITIVNPQEER